ncbi:MAG: SLC13 family permease, partial [Bacteroidia bacterium]|nr:SLC13 family permease [Bacteroidia bacterium]
MEPKLIIVSIIVAFMVIALYREWFKPVIVFLISTTAFVASGIIDPVQALSGFANEQIAVIFLLLIFSGIIRKTGLLNSLLNSILSIKLSQRSFIARMSILIGSLSGFLNNTPLVAIMLPNVYEWAKRKNISPSKVLLPLSYAAIVGGMLTLIGSSTNLVVNGLAVETGLTPLRFFEFFKVGIVIFIIMCVYLFVFSPILLKDRKGVLTEFKEHTREFVVKTRIPTHSAFIGQTVDVAGLRNLRGLFLVEIIRSNRTITPVIPNEVI